MTSEQIKKLLKILDDKLEEYATHQRKAMVSGGDYDTVRVVLHMDGMKDIEADMARHEFIPAEAPDGWTEDSLPLGVVMANRRKLAMTLDLWDCAECLVYQDEDGGTTFIDPSRVVGIGLSKGFWYHMDPPVRKTAEEAKTEEVK